AVTLKGMPYCGETPVGVELSVVYRIVAPGVSDAGGTVTGPGKLPPAGLIVGVATVGGVMVNVALATALSVIPGANARALTVLVAVTLKGMPYCGEAPVGVELSVVYRMVA